eukprot:FR742767.1.p1 GENE.FR742767.1~~FR742767.1.p1  ORF type:complete len:248 (+),score=7.33 FR742767.1:82-744(+)
MAKQVLSLCQTFVYDSFKARGVLRPETWLKKQFPSFNEELPSEFTKSIPVEAFKTWEWDTKSKQVHGSSSTLTTSQRDDLASALRSDGALYAGVRDTQLLRDGDMLSSGSCNHVVCWFANGSWTQEGAVREVEYPAKTTTRSSRGQDEGSVVKSTMDKVRMILTRTFGSLDQDTEGALSELNSALHGQRAKVERRFWDQQAKGKKGNRRKCPPGDTSSCV